MVVGPVHPGTPSSIYETPTIGPVTLEWWWDPNGVYVPGGGGGSSDGSDPGGGGDTGGSGGDAGGSEGGGTGGSAGGVPGGTGGTGGTNGGDDDEEPGWQEPPCGGYWQGEEFVRNVCPDIVNPSDTTIIADSIPGILSRACDNQMDSVFNWGIENNFREQSFIIVKSGESIYSKNYLAGTPDGTKTKVNYTLASGELLLGYFHTHPVENDFSGRSFFSFNDIQEARKNAAIQYYCAILECGNKRFALVIEKPELLNRFITLEKLKELKNLKLEYNAMELPVYNTNRQQASIEAVVSYFGSSSVCGVSFYEASSPNKTTFTKLNP